LSLRFILKGDAFGALAQQENILIGEEIAVVEGDLPPEIEQGVPYHPLRGEEGEDCGSFPFLGDLLGDGLPHGQEGILELLVLG
jgi:hypothetical protein